MKPPDGPAPPRDDDDVLGDVLVRVWMQDVVTLRKLRKIVSSLEHDAREGAYHLVRERDVEYVVYGDR